MSDREAFEEAASRLGYRLKMADTWSGEYVDPESDTAWHLWQEACAWQAARSQGGEAEPVAWSLRWPEDDSVNAMTTFSTEDLARRYADRCQNDVTVVPLYTHPPRQQGGVPEGWKFERESADRITIEADGIGFYVANINAERIADIMLYALAQDLLPAAPADKPEGEWVKTMKALRDSISGDCYMGEEWELETIDRLLSEPDMGVEK